MANGTSGDTNCIDFSRPNKPFTYHEVGQYVASRILDALPNAQFDLNPTLNARFTTIEANVRLADPKELEQAKAYVQSKLGDRLPTTLEENYARETVLLSEMPPTRALPLQALQIGKMVIAAYPTETYPATGQSVRLQSQFPFTLNIGLANDLAGYLPPANQFPLGGYTTWRARTSCLAENTEYSFIADEKSEYGRFFIRFGNTNTGLTSSDINVTQSGSELSIIAQTGECIEQIEIYTITGARVYSAMGNSNLHTVNLNLSPAMYLIRVKTSIETQNLKFNWK
jgi:hypothetical protein